MDLGQCHTRCCMFIAYYTCRVHMHFVCVDHVHVQYRCTVCHTMLQTSPSIGATTRWSRRATTACAWRGRVTSASRTSPCTGAAPTGYRKLNAWSVSAPFSCADILGWLYILQQNRGVCFCVIYDVLSGGCLQLSLAASLFVHSFVLRALMLHVHVHVQGTYQMTLAWTAFCCSRVTSRPCTNNSTSFMSTKIIKSLSGKFESYWWRHKHSTVQ